MRPVKRLVLATVTARKLQSYQAEADGRQARNTLAIDDFWKQRRKNAPLQRSQKTTRHRSAVDELYTMAGPRERCFYCVDSQGTDIEHFWPKGAYPEKMFVWGNLLLCCSACGSKYKGKCFPLDQSSGRPLLIDPTSVNPWDHLDFDPVTGIITARFLIGGNQFSPLGEKTVTVLKLDSRESLSRGYLLTYGHLVDHVRSGVQNPPQTRADRKAFVDHLLRKDDHGLLGWCFHADGQNTVPFTTLKQTNGRLWVACRRATLPPVLP